MQTVNMFWDTFTRSCFLLLVVMEFAKGKLVFRNPLHEPRIYEGAPAGVHVATVVAYDPGRKSVLYNLLDVRDHTYFSMDSASGNISTSKAIDKKLGDSYELHALCVQSNYISFIGPSCLILFVNLTVFLMVTRVLFTPRNVSAKKPPQCSKKEKFLVTTAQVRGAFTVMNPGLPN